MYMTMTLAEGSGSSLGSEPDQQVSGQSWGDGRTKKRLDSV